MKLRYIRHMEPERQQEDDRVWPVIPVSAILPASLLSSLLPMTTILAGYRTAGLFCVPAQSRTLRFFVACFVVFKERRDDESSGYRSGKDSMKKTIIAALMTAVMVLSLAACGGQGGGSGSGAAEGGSFIYGLAGEVSDFDPFSAGGTANGRSITFNIYEGLVKVAPDGSTVPAVASDVVMAEDAKAYTFTLREGVKFHDGSDVTMDDVIYSLQKGIDSALPGYDKIASYEATDDTTLVISLAEPDTGFLVYMTQAIVPAGSDDNGELTLAPIGTGPYKFESYEVQESVTLIKNEDYWGEGGSLDEVTIRFLADQTAQLTNFQGGSIDGFEAYGGMSEQLEEGTYNLYDTNSNMVQVLALNNQVKPFDDVRVRQAIAYAIDADDIIETVNYGHAVKAGTPVPPSISKYYNEEVASAYDINTDRAKELLKEAGYEKGFTFTVRVADIFPVHVDCAQLMVKQLEAIGVTMQIEQVDWNTWLNNVYSNREYEATLVSVDGSTVSPTAFLSRYVSTARNNFVNFSSEAYDAAYQAAVSETDDEKQVEYFKQAQQILSDECASVFIEDIGSLTIYSKDFEGYVGYPLTAMDFTAVHKAE